MKLKEIRAAYAEILSAWNVVSPPIAQSVREDKEMMADSVDMDEESTMSTMGKLRKVHPELKREADQSGNAQVWHRGESLDGLSPGMKERIERALRFGI
jgi:hypothetical protein